MELELPPSSEIVDPRQQTLHKFFQSSQSSFQPRASPLSQHPHASSPSNSIFPQRQDFDMVSTVTSVSHDTSASVGMDMEMDSGREEAGQDIRKWMGGHGWMP